MCAMPHVSHRISVPFKGTLTGAAPPTRALPERRARVNASPAASRRERRMRSLRFVAPPYHGRHNSAVFRDVAVGGLLSRLAETLPEAEALVYRDLGLRWTFRA